MKSIADFPELKTRAAKWFSEKKDTAGNFTAALDVTAKNVILTFTFININTARITRAVFFT